MAETSRVANVALAILLIAISGLAIWLITADYPLMRGLGLLLAAAGPLAFLAGQALRPQQPGKQHPVMVSVGCGLGCVMIMVAIQRFGEQHQWVLVPALAALCGWMGYQRWCLRKVGQTGSAEQG
ncbi:MAG: hypothetical protein LAT56_01170 [Wenzhouxiangella sp.]|nr:hypothetical protein [Wenzhouxiangella sp.]